MIILKIIFLILFFAILLVGCGSDGFKSEKLQSKIIVDGRSEDWTNLPLTYIEDMEMVIGFAHNDTSLFVMFRFSDQKLARKIHMRGAILWLDPTFDEDKEWGVRYRREFIGPRPNLSPMNSSDLPPVILDGNFAVVRGEDKLSTGLEFYPGVRGAAGNEKNLYVFEFSFPMDSNSDDVLRAFTANSPEISIGVEIESISKEEREMMKQKMTEGSQGGRSGGGRSGGGMKGGGRGGQSSMMGGRGNIPDMDREEIWMTINLSKS